MENGGEERNGMEFRFKTKGSKVMRREELRMGVTRKVTELMFLCNSQ